MQEILDSETDVQCSLIVKKRIKCRIKITILVTFIHEDIPPAQ